MKLSTCCSAEPWLEGDVETDICSKCKEHAGFEDDETKLERAVRIMNEGYAGFLPGGVIVDIRKHPEARPAPGRDGRNARKLNENK